MMSIIRSRWAAHLIKAAALVLTAAVFSLGGVAQAVQACKQVKGKLEVQPVTGPACLSPVGLCSEGTISGDIKGRFVFTATSLNPTADTPLTSVLQFTGDSVIHTAAGELRLKDTGAVSTGPTGDTIDLAVIVGGTGRLSGASGAIRTTGTFTPAGGGQSDYSGQVCGL